MLKRKILIGLLGFGTIFGYGMGFASMKCHAKQRRDAFEARIAETCVRAAQQQQATEGPDAQPTERGGERGEHGRRKGRR